MSRPPEPKQRIAFVGLGRMGLPMAARLAGHGFEVTGADLRPDRRHHAADAGVGWAETGAGAAAAADLLITMLPGPRELRAAAPELVGTLRLGAIWLEMSTGSPQVARELIALAHGRGIGWLDAPVGGGPAEAAGGSLLAFVGGEAAELAAVAAVLEVLTERVLAVGPAGSGYAVKLLVNTLWFGQAVATAEALALAQRLGLELEVVRAALAQSAAGSRFLDRDAVALLAGDDLTTFGLAGCCEELASVVALADELQVPVALATLVDGIHRRALERYGDIDGELLGARLVAEQAGVDLRA